MKTKQILEKNSEQNSENYLVFDFDGVLLDGLLSDISTDIHYDLQDGKFSNAFESVLNLCS